MLYNNSWDSVVFICNLNSKPVFQWTIRILILWICSCFVVQSTVIQSDWWKFIQNLSCKLSSLCTYIWLPVVVRNNDLSTFCRCWCSIQMETDKDLRPGFCCCICSCSNATTCRWCIRIRTLWRGSRHIHLYSGIFQKLFLTIISNL